ncbi:YjcZ family sporulation protein [Bacillus glycinifermentans]
MVVLFILLIIVGAAFIH